MQQDNEQKHEVMSDGLASESKANWPHSNLGIFFSHQLANICSPQGLGLYVLFSDMHSGQCLENIVRTVVVRVRHVLTWENNNFGFSEGRSLGKKCTTSKLQCCVYSVTW